MIRRILVLGAISLALGVAARLMTAPAPAVAGSPTVNGTPDETLSATTEEGRSLLVEVATLPTPRLRSLTLSPDGSTLAWVDDRGVVRRVDVATKRTLWRTSALEGVNALRATSEGHVVAASLMNPSSPTVRVLHPRWGEKRAATFPVSGAVWDLDLERDGTHVIVGTGDKSVHVLPVSIGSPPPAGGQPGDEGAARHWSAPGIPASVAVAASAERPVLLLGLWQSTGVSARRMDGTSRWRADSSEPERAYDVLLSDDGSTGVAVSTRGRRGGEVRIDVWDVPSGKRLWSESLAAREGRALVSRNGQSIAVSYVREGDSGGPAGYRIALFDRSGQRMFADKGSAVFHPRLVSLAPDGSRLVLQSGLETLFVLDRRGRFLGKRRLAAQPRAGQPVTIKGVATSADGRYLVLKRSDDQITLFKALF